MHKDTILANLNEEQRKAVLHQTGPMLVTAGPGSGKTHVIISRLLYMINEWGIAAEKIAVITYSKEAARSMSSRFQKIFKGNESVFFGTFHSFYYQILRSSSNYSEYRLIYEKEKKYLLSGIVQTEDEAEKEQLIDTLIKSFSYYKNTLDLTNSVKIAEIDQEIFLMYFHNYENEKASRRCMDFDDMLYLCMKLLEKDHSLKKKWQIRFDYYLVDEFQDCNWVQYSILNMLALKENIFVVGDDDQAIYGFRGANVNLMKRFMSDHPEAKVVNLGVNYRCAKKIVKASSAVISENQNRIDKSLSAYRMDKDDEYVKVVPWKDRQTMYRYFREIFSGKTKEELNSHALLFRTNQEMQIFAIDLMKVNIPFQMKQADSSVYDHFIIKDMEAFWEIAEGNYKREMFLRIINKPKRGIGREAFTEEWVDLEQVSAFYSNSYMCNDAALKEVNRLKIHISRLRSFSMSFRIKYIRKAMGYDQYLIKRAGGNEILLTAWFELLAWLEEYVKDIVKMSEWHAKKDAYKEKHIRETSYDKKNDQGVYLMTLHASKGLEFDHCYIVNVNDGTIPKYQKGEKLSAEQVEEERRLLYVGMTRAKKTLELHYLTGTKERPKFPSRFIEKLMK